MDERHVEYGFCPKCGAVTHNGVCQSCGRGKKPGAFFDRKEPSRRASGKGMSGNRRMILALVVILVILLLIFVGSVIRAVTVEKERSSKIQIDGDEFDYYDDESDYDYGDWYDDYESEEEYEPGPEDDYYKEFVDAAVSGLSYEIEWNNIYLYPEEPERSEYYSCDCPLVICADKERMAKVNEVIRAVVCKHQDSYREYDYGVSTVGYVAYMGEDMLSLAVRSELYSRESSVYELDAVTIDMETGEVIPYGEMVQADEELAKRFRAQDEYQNGTAEFVKGLTDEELLAYLQDDGKRVAFYSPVGLELGFNYDGGWVTVTLKDKEL